MGFMNAILAPPSVNDGSQQPKQTSAELVEPGVSEQIISATPGPFAPTDCDPAADTLRLQAVTVNLPVSANAQGDILVQFPSPGTVLILASVGPLQAAEANGLYLHFSKLGKQYASGNVSPDGTEAWIELHNADISTTVFRAGSFIKFKRPITRFYLTVGKEGSTGPLAYTWILTDDIDTIYFKPAASVNG